MNSTHDPQSYWQATAPATILPVDLPPTANVVVVGGGFFGAATTLFLARAGAAPILVEQAAPAYGATGRNGGFHVVGTAEGYADAVARLGRETARAIMQITLDSRALLRQALVEEQIACDYREPGHLTLALGEAQYADLQRHVAALRADGFAAELFDRQQTQAFIRTPLSEEITGALYGPENALLHSARLVYGLIAAAQRHGARLAMARVERLVPHNGHVRVITNCGVVEAGAVVVTVNAWTHDLIPTLCDVITPVRGQALAYAPIPRVFEQGIGASVTPTGEYWHQTPDGSIVIGGCRALAPGRDVGVTETVPTPEVIAAIEEVLPRLFPHLSGLEVTRRWAGLMAFTTDYVPVADAAPAMPGVWVAGGFCGHGMPFGMRFGQLLAEAALSGVLPAALTPFRVTRPTLQPRHHQQ
ncbi:NAD(P)/FAD-dependent oxidoreductase [Roseiflexus castenholzii]|uniref:NAD(P)/FAD-dependent oxidoreductase n=1 Tax=Roseiflexus castenholzii TaxID=120962 RepID=UPI003C7EBD55